MTISCTHVSTKHNALKHPSHSSDPRCIIEHRLQIAGGSPALPILHRHPAQYSSFGPQRLLSPANMSTVICLRPKFAALVSPAKKKHLSGASYTGLSSRSLGPFRSPHTKFRRRRFVCELPFRTSPRLRKKIITTPKG